MAEPTYDQALLLGYVEDDLSDADRARFEQQCEQDPALKALAKDLVRDRAALRAIPPASLPRDLVQDVIHQQERSQLLGQPDTAAALEGDEARQGRAFRLTRVLASSALAALVVICSGVLLVTLTDPGLLDMTQQFTGFSEPQAREKAGAPMIASRDVDRSESASAQAPMASASKSAPAPSRANLDRALKQARADLAQEDHPDVEMDSSAFARAEAQTPREGLARHEGRDDAARQASNKSAPAKVQSAQAASSSASVPAAALVSQLQVNIETDSPTATTRQLYAWADRNQAQIVRDPPQPAMLAGAMMAQDASGEAGLDASASPALPGETAEEQLVLWLADNQLPGLMIHLNQRAGQRAELEGPVPAASAQALDGFKEDKRLVATRSARLGQARLADRERPDAFSWGQVLEPQLPLAQPTPIAHLPRRVPVTLNVLPQAPESATTLDPASTPPPAP